MESILNETVCGTAIIKIWLDPKQKKTIEIPLNYKHKMLKNGMKNEIICLNVQQPNDFDSVNNNRIQH